MALRDPVDQIFHLSLCELKFKANPLRNDWTAIIKGWQAQLKWSETVLAGIGRGKEQRLMGDYLLREIHD